MSIASSVAAFGTALLVASSMLTYAAGVESWCQTEEARLRQPCPAHLAWLEPAPANASPASPPIDEFTEQP